MQGQGKSTGNWCGPQPEGRGHGPVYFPCARQGARPPSTSRSGVRLARTPRDQQGMGKGSMILRFPQKRSLPVWAANARPWGTMQQSHGRGSARDGAGGIDAGRSGPCGCRAQAARRPKHRARSRADQLGIYLYMKLVFFTIYILLATIITLDIAQKTKAVADERDRRRKSLLN